MTDGPLYGPAVLGQEEYDRQLAANKASAGVYGPAFTAPDEYGPAVGDGPGDATTPGKLADAPPEEATGLSVKKLKAVLEGDPGLNEQVLENELARVDGPRKSALREVAKVERLKENPRPGLIDRVEALLEGLG
jgi:hypothetical protein